MNQQLLTLVRSILDDNAEPYVWGDTEIESFHAVVCGIVTIRFHNSDFVISEDSPVLATGIVALCLATIGEGRADCAGYTDIEVAQFWWQRFDDSLGKLKPGHERAQQVEVSPDEESRPDHGREAIIGDFPKNFYDDLPPDVQLRAKQFNAMPKKDRLELLNYAADLSGGSHGKIAEFWARYDDSLANKTDEIPSRIDAQLKNIFPLYDEAVSVKKMTQDERDSAISELLAQANERIPT